tara:strand:- start:350 stop:748 length:399 start_codon:yes stop_codon:yes gene_type:complete
MKDNNRLLLKLSARIMASYVANNRCDPENLVEIFNNIFKGLKTIENSQQNRSTVTTPAVPIENSIQHNRIICLEDGKPFKMLKRHLASNYNMTPEQYRSKWNLPSDYPMVAPSYSEKRRELAKKSGLGRANK